VVQCIMAIMQQVPADIDKSNRVTTRYFDDQILWRSKNKQILIYFDDRSGTGNYHAEEVYVLIKTRAEEA
jgi:hypothetical protein